MFKCTKCEKSYKKEGYLDRHLIDKHAEASTENRNITLAVEDDDISRQLEEDNTFMKENAVNENAVQFHGDIQDQNVFTQELLQPTRQGFEDILLGSNSVILGMSARLDEIQDDLDVSANDTLDNYPPFLVAST